MDKVIQLITNWLESDSNNLKTTLYIPFKECYVLFNILSFIPDLKECGVCYQKEERRKCSSCEFILCILCAPKLRRPICPHCQSNRSFGVLTYCKTGYSKDCGFFLNTAGVCYDKLRFRHQLQEVQISQRIGNHEIL